MFRSTFKAACLAAVVPAAFAEEQTENNYTSNRAWMSLDLIVGLVMGSYGPVQNLAYDGSCYSKWYNFGSGLTKWYKLFDTELSFGADVHTAILAYEALDTFYSGYNMM